MLFLPSDAELVSEHLAVARVDERMTFFDASGPIFVCSERDEGALRFAAVMFTEPSLGVLIPNVLPHKSARRNRGRWARI